MLANSGVGFDNVKFAATVRRGVAHTLQDGAGNISLLGCYVIVYMPFFRKGSAQLAHYPESRYLRLPLVAVRCGSNSFEHFLINPFSILFEGCEGFPFFP